MSAKALAAGEVRSPSAAEARAELVAARERAKRALEETQAQLGSVGDWREVVRKHPYATIGGAFLVGYTLARLLNRR